MLEIIKIDLSIDFISQSKKIIENSPHKKIFYITPNKRPLWFLKRKLDVSFQLKTEFFTIDEFILFLVTNCYENLAQIHSKVERELFFLDFLMELDEFKNEQDYKIFPFAKRLSNLFNEIDKQKLEDKLSDFIYTEQIEPAKKIVENLRTLYFKYLKKYNFLYSGKLYRLASEINNFSFLKEHLIIFSGFVYLSNSEIDLIKKLSQETDVYFLIHTDLHNRDKIENITFESFKVIDEVVEKFNSKKISIIEGRFYKPYFEIYEFPTYHEEASFIVSLLKEKNFEKDKTAVILPDENLLFPLLSYLKNLGHNSFNITMGFNFNKTEFGIFIENLLKTVIEIYLSKTNKISAIQIYNLINSFIFSENSEFELEKKRIENEITDEISIQNYKKIYSILKKFLEIKSVSDLKEAFEYLYSIINFEKFDYFLKYTVSLFYEEFVNKLNQIKPRKINPIFAYHFLKEIINDLKIPFEGHPLKGYQIMGMLEARGLCFENLIIADVNEKILPNTEKIDPLLPEPIKREIGLSSYKEKEALIKYNLFRLIYSSKKVYLLYRTGSTSDEKIEKSRFIEQIILTEKIDKVNKTQFILPLKKGFSGIEINEEIFNYFKKAKFSPTELDLYMKCPYSYYLKKIKNIPEPVEINHEIPADKVGNFIHKIFEDSFKPYVDKTITFTGMKKICKKIKEKVNFVDEYFKELNSFQKKALKLIIEFRIDNFLDYILSDKDNFKNFKLIGVEKNYENKNLQGKFDRIDLIEEENRIRIVDYKTGLKVLYPHERKLEEIEKIEGEYSENNLKLLRKIIKSFQIPCYIILGKNHYPEKNITLTIYNLSAGKNEKIEHKFDDNKIDWFKKAITYIINFMRKANFLYAIPDNYCNYCEYRKMCKFC